MVACKSTKRERLSKLPVFSSSTLSASPKTVSFPAPKLIFASITLFLILIVT
jgi:hypothetical protein